jgi:hypothetical protein
MRRIKLLGIAIPAILLLSGMAWVRLNILKPAFLVLPDYFLIRK